MSNLEKTVYYLDDEPDICEVFHDIFSTQKFHIDTFTHPDKLAAAIKAKRPDLIILDYRLPGTTGDAVAQSLDPKIPKVLVTGEIHLETVYKFEKIFSKPFQITEMENYLSSNFG